MVKSGVTMKMCKAVVPEQVSCIGQEIPGTASGIISVGASASFLPLAPPLNGCALPT